MVSFSSVWVGRRRQNRHNRAVQDVATAGRHLRATLANGMVTYGTTAAFTRSLRRIVWPVKFKPDLPPRYDGKNNPLEFLQLYTLAIQATGGDDKVMANWFPMALKDSASSWLTNIPADSIDSWEDLCKCFVANFKGTYERGLTYNDLRAVRQKPGETQIGRAHV